MVRDRIAEIISATGKRCEVRVLNEEEYLVSLKQKLGEELQEYLQTEDLVELADLVEVIKAIVRSKGLSIEDFEQMRLTKRNDRGGFDQRLLLVSVTE